MDIFRIRICSLLPADWILFGIDCDGPRFCSDHCLLLVLDLDLFLEIMSLRAVVPVTLFSEMFIQDPNSAEATREFCRKISETCGQYCLVAPFVELGTALTMGKSMAHGVLFDELNVTPESCMLQGVHTRGLSAFVSEGRDLTQCLKEAEISYYFVSTCLWSDQWDSLPDPCLETLGNAAAALTDLKLLLKMSISGAQKTADSEAGCVGCVAMLPAFQRFQTFPAIRQDSP